MPLLGKGLRPGFSVRLPGSSKPHLYSETFTVRRHWGAIGALAVFNIIFAIPAVLTFQEASDLWQQRDGLFSVITALFLTFWLVGWSLGLLTMTAILMVLLFGREQISASHGELTVELGLPFIGLLMRYDAASIRNLRIQVPEKNSGTSWRGSHAVFDYGDDTFEFGIDLAEEGLQKIAERIETATGIRLRRGEARAEELAPQPDPEPVAPPQRLAPTASMEPLSLASPSSLLLIAANIVPLAGAVLWNWDLGLLMLLYWAESAVIGLFNVCKMVVIGKWLALGAAPFFLAHFGGFMAIHFLFIYTLFLGGMNESPAAPDSLQQVTALFLDIWPALLALFISHGFSFFHNFVGREEYRQRTVRTQMTEPYSRIIFMHMVIIFGGALSMMLGDITPVLMGVIVLKTGIDLRAHLKQHSEEGADKAG